MLRNHSFVYVYEAMTALFPCCKGTILVARAEIKIQVPICLVNWETLTKFTHEMEDALQFLPLEMIAIIVVYAHVKKLSLMTISPPPQNSLLEQNSGQNDSTFIGFLFETRIH